MSAEKRRLIPGWKKCKIRFIRAPVCGKQSFFEVNLLKIKLAFLLIFLLCFGSIALVYGAEKKTDPYAPVYSKEPLKAAPLKDPVSMLLAFPFELVKWPVDQALLWTEKLRLDKKTKWLYEKSVEYGVTPIFDSLDFASGLSFFYGGSFDLIRMTRLKEKYPDMIAKVSINHGTSTYFQVGTEVGFQRIAETGLHAGSFFDYENSRDETFYGIGPNSSLGDSTSYIKEKTTVGVSAGYEFSPAWDLTSQVAYDHVNIKNRAHSGKGDITQIFSRQDIPGLHGDDLLGLSLKLTRDTRDSKEDATKGSYQKLSLKFTEGVDSSPARYLTYQLDMAKYFQLASPRRILVTRLFGEFNQTVNHGTVPFYEMTKLGGAGLFPRPGQTERAFVYNRFCGQSAILLNLEYRYTIWEYREFQMKTAFFVDEGQVSKNFGTFQFDNFKTSYGLGFYLSYSKLMLLNFSVAHGDEGTQFYVENKVPF